MKKFSLLAAALIATCIALPLSQAQADSIRVLQHSSIDEFSRSEFRFANDGRAWLKLLFLQERFRWVNGQMVPYYVRKIRDVAVPGLSYDTAAAQFIFATQSGSKVVCANVRPDTSMWGNPIWVITPTGACKTSRKGRTEVWFTAN